MEEQNAELRKLVDNELDKFVLYVLKRQDRIIPIVGDDCFFGKIKRQNGYISVPFQQWLAEELLENLSSDVIKNKIVSQGYYGLDCLFEEYKKQTEEDFCQFIDSISYLIENGVEDGRLGVRKDVESFLSAGHFEVIVTTCPYDIMFKGLKCGDKCYSISSFAPQKVTIGESKSEAVLELPAIYQLFGNSNNEFVFGEDSLLRFLHYLNQSDIERGFGASQLVKYMKDKGADNKGFPLLMPIGCSNLPNWIFRFLWYPFCLNPEKDSNKQGGVWYKYSDDKSFCDFLKNYNFRTLSKATDILRVGTTTEDPVLSRLTAEFNAKEEKIKRYISQQPNIETSNNGEWDVFISYAGEDFDFSQKVYDILTEECNQKVWMDKRGTGRINAGNDYWDVIQLGIEHSHKFLFVITENYLKKAKGKNHRDETTGAIGPTGVYREIELIRHHILNKRKDAEKNNIIPVIVEGTKVTYTDINNKKHMNESLGSGMLEKLPYFEEYALMQTQDLFRYVHDMVCNGETLKENLKSIFKS